MDVIWGVSVNEVAWGGLIAIYLFLAGIAGGAFLTASLTDLFSKRYPKVIRSGAYIAVVSIIIGLGLLVVDLGRPLSFWKLLLNVNMGSVMSIGVFIVSGFTALSVVYGYLIWSSAVSQKQVKITSANTEVTPTSVGQGLQAFRKPVAGLGVLFSIGTATYTGFLLSAVTTNNFWYTPFLGIEAIPFLPILFLVSASSTGLAATMIGACKCGDLTAYKKVDMVLIMLEIVLIAILYLSVEPIFFGGSMAALFWLGVVIVGLIVPLLLSFYGITKHKNVILPVCGMVVLGGLSLRYFVVYTGQLF
ncbi:NrfD/PsrC family molybdoenzyme membrane anchor subunit [Desulfosporosinus sp.]|uniref:NrfD/PsrC family molybdoenzyme membrane anchor subunit n=1 Tax=Desulfosporosinus sp. TaxID=157907 RepID=UPI002314E9E9|nr:NrfD/PsrC family molybdoenzyme membrane anchor subunit [Desulfosporosinus sp.]MCO5387699.1 polysulfide reductase NrfD [Desulfosporosinus sp.]MDA8224061.1 polysulfide reductase NrfD [Desulfitobacterium hafniense]